MNIFGIGELELLLIIIIALIVAGPKRMIQWMYVLGRWVAKLRRMWSEAMVLVQRELNEAGLDVEVPKDLPTRGELRRVAQKALQPLASPVQDAINEVKTVGTELQNTANQARGEIRDVRANLKLTVPPVANGVKPPVEESKPDEGDFGSWSRKSE
jgi:Sec-independent protein translocase protein TatA